MTLFSKIDVRIPGWELKVLESFKSTGFAVLKNHGIAETLISDTYDAWATFFASPEKFEYLRKEGSQAGYFPLKSENAAGYSAKDLKEFQHVYEGQPCPPGVRSSTYALCEQLQALAEKILSGLDISLPSQLVTTQSLSSMASKSSNTLLRALHYPPLPAHLDDPNAVRAAAHTDINLVTILCSATAPGLEVLSSSGEWLPIDSNPGEIVLNAGDMLSEATGGYLKSTSHRVINPVGDNISRYSLPFFVHPKPSVRLSARYTAGEYLDQRLKEIGLLK